MQPYIADWLSRGHTMGELERLSGINVRTIHEVVRFKRDTVRFHTADCLLLAMDKEYAWRWDDNLSGIYAAA